MSVSHSAKQKETKKGKAMSEKINIKKGDETDVMERIIDFGPLDTSSREDDGAWNVMKLYGENDQEEGEYQSSREMSSQELEEVLRRVKAAKIGESILDVIA